MTVLTRRLLQRFLGRRRIKLGFVCASIPPPAVDSCLQLARSVNWRRHSRLRCLQKPGDRTERYLYCEVLWTDGSTPIVSAFALVFMERR
jgi:hypothetical protein